MALPNVSVEPTAGGASAEVDGIFEDEPMCMLTTVCVSAQASKNGSHSPEWIEGNPRYGGISEKQVARTPRAALRRISSAASLPSHNGMMMFGMRRPLVPPHHSSTIQSL